MKSRKKITDTLLSSDSRTVWKVTDTAFTTDATYSAPPASRTPNLPVVVTGKSSTPVSNNNNVNNKDLQSVDRLLLPLIFWVQLKKVNEKEMHAAERETYWRQLEIVEKCTKAT